MRDMNLLKFDFTFQNTRVEGTKGQERWESILTAFMTLVFTY